MILESMNVLLKSRVLYMDFYILFGVRMSERSEFRTPEYKYPDNTKISSKGKKLFYITWVNSKMFKNIAAKM